jgi:hypothetical protein
LIGIPQYGRDPGPKQRVVTIITRQPVLLS